MTRRIFRGLGIVGLGLLLLIGFALLSLSVRSRLKPRAGQDQFEDFVRTRPAHLFLDLSKKPGGENLLLWGSTAPLWTLPSGPAVYVFDAQGKLVDWTTDVGDDMGFHGKWIGDHERISLEEARRWLASKKASR